MTVTTTKGEMDESLLEKREGYDPPTHPENPFSLGARWVEYWLNGELVHRSVALGRM